MCAPRGVKERTLRNSKTQAPGKFQTPGSKIRTRAAASEFETWSFFGVWNLGFGDFIRTRAPESGLIHRRSVRPDFLQKGKRARVGRLPQPQPRVLAHISVSTVSRRVD